MNGLSDAKISKVDCRGESTRGFKNTFEIRLTFMFGNKREVIHTKSFKKGLSREDTCKILENLAKEIRDGYLNEYK